MISVFGGSNNGARWWNGKNPEKPGYSQTIEGTIVQIEATQARKFGNQWDYWPSGDPKRACRLTILNAVDGQDYLFEFNLGKNSGFSKAIVAAMPTVTDVEELAGKYVRITCLGKHQEGKYNVYDYNLEIGGDNPQLYRGTIDWEHTTNKDRGGAPGYGNPQPSQGYQQWQQPQQQWQQQSYQQPMTPPGQFTAQQPPAGMAPNGYAAQAAGFRQPQQQQPFQGGVATGNQGFQPGQQAAGFGAPNGGGFAPQQQPAGGFSPNAGGPEMGAQQAPGVAPQANPTVFGSSSQTNVYDESIPF